MLASSTPIPGWLLRLSAVSGLGSLALALAAASNVVANPFGVTRQGGDEIAAIRSLTPEDARTLVTKRTDATARIDTGRAALAFARGGVTFRGALMLSGLESLDAETASVLADYDEGPLFLDGLAGLSSEAARALKQFKGGPRSYASFGRCLSLAGLETLSPEAAAELAAFGGEALFLGVTELSETAFRSLMKFRRRLYLPRLAGIPAGAAESIADYRGPGLSILGLATLSMEEARVLAGLGNRWNGRLPNVKNLSSETAAVLAGLNGVKKGVHAQGPFLPPKVVRLEFDGATLSAETARELAGFPGVLLLRGMTQAVLSDDMLAALAEYNGGGLGLGGLTAVSPDLAQRLATVATKFLFLDDVTELSPEAAQVLADFPGTVSLDGLTGVSPELVGALGDLRKRSLKGVTSLSPEAAAAVVEGFRGASLTLNLTSLPADTAKELAQGRRNDLILDRLTELSDEAAAALGGSSLTNLWLRGLTDLSPGAAKGLAGLKAAGQLGPTLRLDSMRSLSPEAAEAFAASNITYLELSGLKTLSADTARALSRSKAFSGSLPSLTTLSADAAVALSTFAGNKSGGGKLNLFGLTTLDAEAARGLAAFRGTLELDGLTEIDAETAAALATYAGPKLSLRGLKTLSTGAAEQLAKAKAWDGRLSSLRGLSDEAATALAGFEGKGLEILPSVPFSDRAVQALAGFRGASLYLIVPRLSDESVRALAAFKGDSLSLAGLEEPPAELARLLPEFACQKLSLHPWEYFLGGRQPVTPADARLVAAYAGRLGKTCVLPGIEGFETPAAVEIATMLAASPGSLSIPNLKRVSPKTLTALIEKRNIELPPVESLQLIEEPDGSFTDDFVIPENFPTRRPQ